MRVYTTWGTTDPDDIGFETGCLRDDADLPDGWLLEDEDAQEPFVPADANPAFTH